MQNMPIPRQHLTIHSDSITLETEELGSAILLKSNKLLPAVWQVIVRYLLWSVFALSKCKSVRLSCFFFFIYIALVLIVLYVYCFKRPLIKVAF